MLYSGAKGNMAPDESFRPMPFRGAAPGLDMTFCCQAVMVISTRALRRNGIRLAPAWPSPLQRSYSAGATAVDACEQLYSKRGNGVTTDV
jgi:hypothetical protein